MNLTTHPLPTFEIDNAARSYRLTGTETWQFFFSYVCHGKKIKELFDSTLNRITASVRCVSFIIVVLNAKLTGLIDEHANKKYSEKRKSPKRVPFFAS